MNPEFKINDWIKSIKYPHLKPIKIKSIYESNTRPRVLGLRSGGTVLYSDEVKLWIPEPDEWCWFWDRTTIDNPIKHPPKLGQYSRYDFSLNYFNYCEPFIGELPSNLKELQ